MEKGKDAFTKWHWGNPPSEVVDLKPPKVLKSSKDQKTWNDMVLIECGRLVEIHYVPFDSNPKRKSIIIKLGYRNSNECHLCFDINHPNHRLYFILNGSAREKFKHELLKDNPYAEVRLPDLALQTENGKHATDDYFDIDVHPVGIITHLVYATDKKGDGMSFYIHEMGEESGIQPALAVSSDGNIWFAGGDYHSPIQGITN